MPSTSLVLHVRTRTRQSGTFAIPILLVLILLMALAQVVLWHTHFIEKMSSENSMMHRELPHVSSLKAHNGTGPPDSAAAVVLPSDDPVIVAAQAVVEAERAKLARCAAARSNLRCATFCVRTLADKVEVETVMCLC
jgi:hypothetical protein